MENEKTWSTSDFYSAAILRASNVPLVKLQKDRGNIIAFFFNESPDVCEKILKQHWDRTLKVESRALIETINELKTRIHEKLKEGRE